MFNVYKVKYTPTGEHLEFKKGSRIFKDEIFDVEMVAVGEAKNMAEAKRKYGGYPILGK